MVPTSRLGIKNLTYFFLLNTAPPPDGRHGQSWVFKDDGETDWTQKKSHRHNIMAVCMILILGYFGDKCNIPQMLGICL